MYSGRKTLHTSRTMDLLERLIADNPAFHEWPDGAPANWTVNPQVLRFIHQHLKPGMNTLETGAGQTTILFAIRGTNHTCITPQASEAERIRNYCSELGIRCGVRFILSSSDEALSTDRLIPDRLDFVFIDGAHRFPFPCIDWHYSEYKLRNGGILGIDDLQIPSVRLLHDFLSTEANWEMIEIIGITSFFRKTGDPDLVLDWQGQGMNAPALAK